MKFYIVLILNKFQENTETNNEVIGQTLPQSSIFVQKLFKTHWINQCSFISMNKGTAVYDSLVL